MLYILNDPVKVLGLIVLVLSFWSSLLVIGLEDMYVGKYFSICQWNATIIDYLSCCSVAV